MYSLRILQFPISISYYKFNKKFASRQRAKVGLRPVRGAKGTLTYRKFTKKFSSNKIYPILWI